MAAIAGICFFGPATAKADLILSVQSVTVNPGSTNNGLEVALTNSGGGPGITIASFTFGLSTTDLDIRFTDVTTSTLNPYIFSGHSIFGPSLVFSPIPPPGVQSLIASDSYDVTSSGFTLAPGATVGLGHVLFDIVPGAAGGTFSLTLDSTATSLSDPDGVTIAINTLLNGTVSINGTVNPVPEPAAFFLLLTAILLIAGAGRRQTNAARNGRDSAP